MIVLRLRFWENEEEYGKSETWVLSKTGPINFSKERFAQIRPVLRETQGSLSMIFSNLLLRPSSKSPLQSQIRLALVERLLEIYFLVDKLVGNNSILLWEILFTILFLLSLFIKGDVCKREGMDHSCCFCEL